MWLARSMAVVPWAATEFCCVQAANSCTVAITAVPMMNVVIAASISVNPGAVGGLGQVAGYAWGPSL